MKINKSYIHLPINIAATLFKSHSSRAYNPWWHWCRDWAYAYFILWHGRCKGVDNVGWISTGLPSALELPPCAFYNLRHSRYGMGYFTSTMMALMSKLRICVFILWHGRCEGMDNVGWLSTGLPSVWALSPCAFYNLRHSRYGMGYFTSTMMALMSK